MTRTEKHNLGHVEEIIDDREAIPDLIAIIISKHYDDPGITFFTEPDASQQVAFMRHPKGKIIKSHIHLPITRTVHQTQEVLIVRHGAMRVDFYGNDKRYLCSRDILEGDLVLLVSGGHSFTMLTEVRMYEVKNGPYAGKEDKVRF